MLLERGIEPSILETCLSTIPAPSKSTIKDILNFAKATLDIIHQEDHTSKRPINKRSVDKERTASVKTKYKMGPALQFNMTTNNQTKLKMICINTNVLNSSSLNMSLYDLLVSHNNVSSNDIIENDNSIQETYTPPKKGSLTRPNSPPTRVQRPLSKKKSYQNNNKYDRRLLKSLGMKAFVAIINIMTGPYNSCETNQEICSQTRSLLNRFYKVCIYLK